MKIRFHKNFERQYKLLSAKQKKKARERLKLFLNNQFTSILNNHPLKGTYLDYRSINIAGDLRAIYKFINDDEYIFVAIGTHNQLYN